MASPTTAERVAQLHAEGRTVLQIAYTLRKSPQAIYKALRKLDLPLPTEREKAS